MSKPRQTSEEEQTSLAPAVAKPMVSRRDLLKGAGGLAVAAATAGLVRAQDAPPDPTQVMGDPASPVGERSPFVTPERLPIGEYPQGPCCSFTPHGDLEGMITPSDLHYERHHNGVPAIDPDEYKLLVHGMVNNPTAFTLDELKRYPRTSRIYFLECSGNSGGHYGNPSVDDTARTVAGLTSTSEWVGVMLSHIMHDVGLQDTATWALFEGMDAAVMTRSWPIERLWDEAMLVFIQNGEPIRPEQGYPVRLIVPGTEGNANIKWLRRIEFADEPWHTREETSKYTDTWCLDGGCAAYQFSFDMPVKSLITWPSGGQEIAGPGRWEIRGIAWSGRGVIDKVEISVDGGNTWHLASLEPPILPKAHTRFRYLWDWDGGEALIMSRAIDSTGEMQLSREQLLAIRGEESAITGYHSNEIFRWRVMPDGKVVGGDV